jgi:hypothetical protein
MQARRRVVRPAWMTRTATLHPLTGGMEFSLVQGGPLFSLLIWGRLCDTALNLVHRRIAAAVLVTWVPLLLLSSMAHPPGLAAHPTFLNDIGIHLRFLLAVPLLIAAELIVHLYLRPIVQQFELRKLVRPHQWQRFENAVAEALTLRNSIAAELGLLVLVYAIGVPLVSTRFAVQTGVWYATGLPGAREITPAGWWLILVSLPIFQFLLVRWYFRLIIWLRFLWRVSRLDLDLDAIHPDKAGGLGFLGTSLVAFLPLAAAHGILLAGVIANRIFYQGAALPQFAVQVVGCVAILLLLFAGPLTVFAPLLAEVKRRGLLEYGAVAQTYVRDFDFKWQQGHAAPDEELLGSSDIQSLADLANSYGVAQDMRLVPLSPRALIYFVLATIAPIVPLVFTLMSATELLGAVAGMFI